MLNTSLEESLQGNETRYCTIEHVKYRSLQLSGSHEAWPGCSEPTCERAGAHSDRNSHPSLNSWVGGSLCSGSEGSPWVCARSFRRVPTYAGGPVPCRQDWSEFVGLWVSPRLSPMTPILPENQSGRERDQQRTFSRCLYFAGKTNGVLVNLLTCDALWPGGGHGPWGQAAPAVNPGSFKLWEPGQPLSISGPLFLHQAHEANNNYFSEVILFFESNESFNKMAQTYASICPLFHKLRMRKMQRVD